MMHILAGRCCLGRLAVVGATLTVALAARPALAQVLFVANQTGNTVGAYNAVTGAPINTAFISGPGIYRPAGLALDGNNHLFATNYFLGGVSTVGQYDATTGATINSAFINDPGLKFPSFLAMDGDNYLFVSPDNAYADAGVGKYNATTGATINANFIPGTGRGLALDRTNNRLFVVSGPGRIGVYDATTGATINADFVTGLISPHALALDAFNNLFVTDYGGDSSGLGNIVGKYDATTGATINAHFITGLGGGISRGLAFDDNNHLFVTIYGGLGAGIVGKYDATTGAVINANFIQGLDSPHGLVFMAPVPEPSSFFIVAVVVTASGLWRRYRS